MKFRKMSFILCIVMFLFSGISAYAAGCELGIALGEKGADVDLAMYKTADIKEGKYVLLPEFEGVEVNLDEINSAEETKEAATKFYDWCVEKKIEAVKRATTDDAGYISFAVNTGVYVIVKESEKGSMAPVLFILTEEQAEQLLILSPKFSVQDDSEGQNGFDDKDRTEDQDDLKNTDNSNDSNRQDGAESAQTGDTAQIVLWGIVLVVALAGILILVRKNHSGK